MINSKLTQIKSNTITLPKTAIKDWLGHQALIRISPDTIILKRVEKSDFWETWQDMKKVSKNITDQDIAKAIKQARQ